MLRWPAKKSSDGQIKNHQLVKKIILTWPSYLYLTCSQYHLQSNELVHFTFINEPSCSISLFTVGLNLLYYNKKCDLSNSELETSSVTVKPLTKHETNDSKTCETNGSKTCLACCMDEMNSII